MSGSSGRGAWSQFAHLLIIGQDGAADAGTALQPDVVLNLFDRAIFGHRAHQISRARSQSNRTADIASSSSTCRICSRRLCLWRAGFADVRYRDILADEQFFEQFLGGRNPVNGFR